MTFTYLCVDETTSAVSFWGDHLVNQIVGVGESPPPLDLGNLKTDLCGTIPRLIDVGALLAASCRLPRPPGPALS